MVKIEALILFLKGKRRYEKISFLESCSRGSSLCPACGGNSLCSMIRLNDSSGRTVIERSACSNCGSTSFTRLPSKDWFSHYYKTKWQPKQSEEVKDSKFARDYDLIIEHINNLNLSKESKICEIGCGYGGILRQLMAKGYKNVCGIEPSPARAEFAKNKLGVPIYSGLVEAVTQSKEFQLEGSFDLIFSNHVLEHIYDPIEVVELLKKMLKPGGFIITVVPTWETEALLFRQAMFLPHLHAFSTHGLCDLFKRAGFRIVNYRKKGAEQFLSAQAEGGLASELNIDFEETDFSLVTSSFAELPLSGARMGQKGKKHLASISKLASLRGITFFLKERFLKLDPSRNLLSNLLGRILYRGKGLDVGLLILSSENSERAIPEINFAFEEATVRIHLK